MTRLLIIESNSPEMMADGRSNARAFTETLPIVDATLDLQVVGPYRAPLDPGLLWDVDGVVFSGSGVSWCVTDPREAPLVVAMHAAFDAGLPVWGSCNGMQLAAFVLGGRCGPSGNGHEDGVAHDITLTSNGVTHPMMADRAPVFDALCTHRDEVTLLPERAVLLAGNAHSPVQAFAYDVGGVDFWGTQYHPEYAPAYLSTSLQKQGKSAQLVADVAAVADDPQAAFRLKTTSGALSLMARTVELRNWIAHVKTRAGIVTNTHAVVT
ncbi:MAG: type 1 glutamine amidotransferase [Paracoccaceae bacterium]|jgi:GMP synthase (glutamine-hydrolysing)